MCQSVHNKFENLTRRQQETNKNLFLIENTYSSEHTNLHMSGVQGAKMSGTQPYPRRSPRGQRSTSTPMIHHEESLLKATLKGLALPKTDVHVPNNARTSLSQLQLSHLALQQNSIEDDMDDFGMKELRGGFFDPIYNKPDNIQDHYADDDQTRKQWWRLNYDIKAKLSEILLKSSENWKILTKFSLAYMISFILCLIDKPGKWFGEYRLFMPVATLLHHPVHAVGIQLEMTIQAIVGLALGLGWSSLALYISVSTQPTRNHQGGILAGSLFIGLFFIGWFKGYFIRFYYMLLASGIVLIFLSSCLELSNPVVNWKLCWSIGIPYLFGVLISLVVSLIYFPYLGPRKIMTSITNTTTSIKMLLMTLTKMDTLSNKDLIVQLQSDAVNHTLRLSENFREFLSTFKLSIFAQDDLKHIRNHINFIVAPLRVIPSETNLFFKEVSEEVTTSTTNTHTVTPGVMSVMDSGMATPVPKHGTPMNIHLHPQFIQGKEFVYVSIMNERFTRPMHKLLLQMIRCIEDIETCLNTFKNATSPEKNRKKTLEKLENSVMELKKKILQLDVAYRKFSKSEYFCRALLDQEQVINIFLFLRYSRQASVGITSLSDFTLKACRNVRSFYKISLPNYPLERSLKRLPERCLRDQGANSIFYYFETKIAVDDAFERIYNLNTSRNKRNQDHHHNQRDQGTKAIRAIDHNDFNFHSTPNPLRYRLWQLSKLITDYQSKYAFKVSFVVIFVSLPSWLKVSWNWYYKYNCFWCPVLIYYFLSPRNSGTWFNLRFRIACWLLGSFWGWLSSYAGTNNEVVIGVFAGVFIVVFSYFFLVDVHPRSSFVGLLAFTIISLNAFIRADDSRNDIWKHSWILSLAVLVALITTVLTNWIIWPFVARKEIYKSCASLLSHIGQSYQSVSERYLYRDEDDDPTDLTLELANIREIRMSQNWVANEELLKRAKQEHDIAHTFNTKVFTDLLDSCHIMLEKLIEARMSGIYFHIWDEDKSEDCTKKLSILRRDSVSTVIYILYVISNAIRTKTKIPRYLPSAIAVRRKLYDLISEVELSSTENNDPQQNIIDQLKEKLTSVQNEKDETESELRDEKSHMKMHWREVHGMAFARAFTAITEQVERIVMLSKELLGEEEIFG